MQQIRVISNKVRLYPITRILLFSFLMVGCTLEPTTDRPVATLTDVELLAGYGTIAHNPNKYANVLTDYDQEIQNRQLLGVKDLDAATNKTVFVGLRNTVLLAGFGKPLSVILNVNEPGLEVWRFLTLDNIAVEERPGNRISWMSRNPNGEPALEAFIRNGIVIGFKASSRHQGKQDLFEMIYRAQSGRVWYIPDNIQKPWVFKGCFFGACDNLSLR